MFSDLSTKGYAVAKSCFDVSDLEDYYQYYLTLDKNFQNQNYKTTNGVMKGKLRESLVKLLKQVSEESNFKINLLSSRTTIFNSDYVNLDWHQDHEVYFLFQQPLQYINCWIPLIKSNACESGIEIIPSNQWGTLHDKIYNRGAQNLHQIDNDHISIKNYDNDSIYTENFNLEQQKVIPEVEVGDCLLFRGDVVHRTQPNSKSRVATSLWGFNRDIVISAEKFLQQGNFKSEMIAGSPLPAYKILSTAFLKSKYLSIKHIVPTYF